MNSRPPIGSATTTLVWSIIALCVLVATFIIVISLVRPAIDNTSVELRLLGVVGPVITGLLAAAIQQLHLAVNSRLTQLIELTARTSHAEGKLAGLMEPVPGADLTAREEGKAAGVEQERQRADDQKGHTP